MKLTKKPLSLAIGTAFALTGAAAQASVFQTADLGAGYMVAQADAKKGEHKCGEGKCGEGKCGEGAFNKMDANKDGMLSKDEFKSAHKSKEGKCGEGKCGEGKCGADKKEGEAKKK